MLQIGSLSLIMVVMELIGGVLSLITRIRELLNTRRLARWRKKGMPRKRSAEVRLAELKEKLDNVELEIKIKELKEKRRTRPRRRR